MRAHNMKLNHLSLQLNSTNLEINAKCRENLCIGIVHETAEDTSLEETGGELRRFNDNEKPHLSDTLIADDKQFEKVVAPASVHGERKRSGGRSQ